MRKFVTAAVLIPLGLILIAFAFANRHFVILSFDPFNATNPALAVSLPLFVVIIAAAIAGVVAGGCATWFGQRHHRRAARRHEAAARAAGAELAALRAGTAAGRRESPQLAAPSSGGLSRASGRDKQDATL
ncbi:MAG: lipopolysaccharide assembly protein LapA domain-containing protein [Bradyrhizobium sp.]